MRKRFVDPKNKKIKFKPMSPLIKKVFFWLMVLPIIFSTIYVSAMTIRGNILSVTGGPVHWHADYELWACGEKLDLTNPKFPRNKIGSSLLHEHNDERIHVEGTVHDLKDVSLKEYFSVLGGSLQGGTLTYPTIEGVKSYSSLDSCPDGTVGKLRVYVNGQRIEDYESYVLYPDAYVPPGDCIIIEFSSTESVGTNKICSSWIAKGWDYSNFERGKHNIGGRRWQ